MIDFSKPFKRCTFRQSLTEIGGVDKGLLDNQKKTVEFALENKVSIEKKDHHVKILAKLFDHFVEPKLVQPVFITDYPGQLSPLSKKKEDDSSLVERFELFISSLIADLISTPIHTLQRMLAKILYRLNFPTKEVLSVYSFFLYTTIALLWLIANEYFLI